MYFALGFNMLEEFRGRAMAIRSGTLLVQCDEPRECQLSRARYAEPRRHDRQRLSQEFQGRQLFRAVDGKYPVLQIKTAFACESM